MLYVLFAFLILYNLIFYKMGKIAVVFFCVTFFFMWILNGWSSGGNDIGNYIKEYNNPELYAMNTPTKEYLYSQIIYCAHLLGLSYRQYSVVVSLFEMIVLFFFFKKNSKYPCLSLGFFLIYPMSFLFTLQRFFLAFTILLVGGIDPLLNKGKYYRLRFLFFVLIASQIHYSMFFFLFFLVADALNEKKTWFISLLLVIMLSSAGMINSVVSFFYVYVDNSKINKILETEQYGSLGRITLLSIIALQFFVVYKINKRKKIIDKHDSISDILYKFNVLSLITIPLTLFFSSSFLRIYIANMIVYYAYYFHMIGNFDDNRFTRKQIACFAIIFFSLAAILFLTLKNENFRMLSFCPLYEQNELINGAF